MRVYPVTHRTATVDRIVGTSVRTDRNGVAYVTLTVSEAGTDEEVTLRMDVTQAGIAAAALSDSERDAVERMREAGYRKWPPEFVQPEFPSETDTGNER